MQASKTSKKNQRQPQTLRKGPLKPEGRITRRVSIAIVFAVSFIAYASTLANGFVYDDNLQVLGNPWIRDTSFVYQILTTSTTSYLNKAANTYRPLMHLVFMADYRFFGLEAWGYHLVSILLHSANSVLVFLIAGELFNSVRAPRTPAPSASRVVIFPGSRQHSNIPSLLAALFFAANPVNSEAVSWVSAVPELTFTLFLFFSLFLYIKFTTSEDEGRRGYLLLSVLSFFASLLGKETAMSLPLLIIAYDFSAEGFGVLRRWKRYAPFAAAVFIYFVLRTYAVGGVIHHKQIDLSAVDALLNAFPLLLKYLWKLILPVNLNALYQFSAVTSVTDPGFIGGAAAASFLFAAAFLLRRARAVFLGIILFIVPLLPVLYVPALSSAAFADRYLYLPSAGFSFILGYLAFCALKRSCEPDRPQQPSNLPGKAMIAASVILILAYTAGAIKRSMVWKDDVTLWSDTVKKSPLNANVRYNLAWALHKKGDLKGAAENYKEVISIDTNAYDAHFNLGVIYMDNFMIDEAYLEFSEALRLKPDYAEAKEKLESLSGLKAGKKDTRTGGAAYGK